MTKAIPEDHKRFDCQEYYSDDDWSENGHYDKKSYTQVIMTSDDAYISPNGDFFAVGRSGFGGIDFGYREGHTGLWAYYPIDDDYKHMADTIADLVDGWTSGRLTI